MLSGIKDILIIVNKGQQNQFKKILPNGKNLGIKISYIEQKEPKGLPDAFIIGENFIKNELEGKVFPVPGCGEGEIKNDLEALNVGIEAEKKSIDVLTRLIADEKKMDVLMIFNHLLAEERKHLAALEELKQTLDQQRVVKSES